MRDNQNNRISANEKKDHCCENENATKMNALSTKFVHLFQFYWCSCSLASNPEEWKVKKKTMRCWCSKFARIFSRISFIVMAKRNSVKMCKTERTSVCSSVFFVVLVVSREFTVNDENVNIEHEQRTRSWNSTTSASIATIFHLFFELYEIWMLASMYVSERCVCCCIQQMQTTRTRTLQTSI